MVWVESQVLSYWFGYIHPHPPIHPNRYVQVHYSHVGANRTRTQCQGRVYIYNSINTQREEEEVIGEPLRNQTGGLSSLEPTFITFIRIFLKKILFFLLYL